MSQPKRTDSEVIGQAIKENRFGEHLLYLFSCTSFFNERHKQELDPIFGCVTTGEAWQFLRLRQRELLVNSDRYCISQISTILGILMSLLSDRI